MVSDTAVFIGIGSILGFDVVIRISSIVAKGCVIPQDNRIPDGKIVAGVQYKIIGDTLAKQMEFWLYGKQQYINLARKYPAKFERIG